MNIYSIINAKIDINTLDHLDLELVQKCYVIGFMTDGFLQ